MNYRLSIIVTCMGRLEHIKQTLPLAISQPLVEYILVDYSCPDYAGKWATTYFPSVRVVEVKNEGAFNMSKARNAGGREANCSWLCFLDADSLIARFFTRRILRLLDNSLRTEDLYLRHPYKNEMGYNGFTVCPRSAFERIGGYDERCEGYGWEDTEFYIQLSALGLREELIPAHLFRAIPHSTESRTQHFKEKDLNRSLARNATLPKRILPLIHSRQGPSNVQ